MRNGEECYCSGAVELLDRVPDTSCSTDCEDDPEGSKRKCGNGGEVFSVWRLGPDYCPYSSKGHQIHHYQSHHHHHHHHHHHLNHHHHHHHSHHHQSHYHRLNHNDHLTHLSYHLQFPDIEFTSMAVPGRVCSKIK